MPSTQKGIVVILPGEARERIAALARSRGRSFNFIMNEAVQRYLVEEAWLVDDIQAAVQEAGASDAVFVTQAEVMVCLDAAIEQERQSHAS